MQHRTRALALIATPVLAAAVGLTATPAQAAPIATGYSTTNLNPSMAAAIRSMPCKGGSVDVILYSASDKGEMAALLGRAACGTKVRLLTSKPKPDGEHEAELGYYVDRLIHGYTVSGKHTEGLLDYGAKVKVCSGACSRSGSAGIQHEKMVMLNDGRGGKWFLSDSGNWTGPTMTAFNDRLTVKDACMWASAEAHLAREWKDKTIKSEPIVKSCDGTYRLYSLPAVKQDPVLAWAKGATCGKGDVVDLAQFYLTTGSSKTRLGSGDKLVDNLIRFRKAGATVRVGVNDRKWSVKQRDRLVRAGALVYDVDVSHSTYDHRKMLDATGCTGGPFGSQGSTTFNATAYTKNANQIVTTRRAADVRAMQAGFSAMVKAKRRVTMGDL